MRDLKSIYRVSLRKRCGKTRRVREIDHLPVQAMLAANFESAEWVSTVFGKLEPWELFHTIPQQEIKEDLKLMKEQRSIKRPPLIQARREDFPELAIEFLNKGTPYPKASGY